MKANTRFVYNRRNSLTKRGEAKIHIEVAFSRSLRRVIDTKISCKPEAWNDKKKELNNKYPAYIQTNQYLRKLFNEVLEYEASLLNDGKELTPELLDNFVNGKKDNSKLFYKFALEEFNKEQMSLGSYRKLGSILRKLDKHSPNLTFSDLNYSYVKDIDNWLKSQDKISSLNTIANYHKIIKKYIGIAINMGLMKYEQNPYNQFKVKKTPTTRTNLREEELEKFINVEIDNPFITKIQDMFIFSCYTGLRYSDIVNLQPKHYIINGDTVTIKIDKMVKTGKPVELPLNMLFEGKPLEIFYKYYKENENFLFGEPLTNQYINRELKFIARTAKIMYKELTFHMARHTFGSLLAEKVGDPYLIKDLMGHSDIKMSMEYIHSSSKGRRDKLMKVKW